MLNYNHIIFLRKYISFYFYFFIIILKFCLIYYLNFDIYIIYIMIIDEF